MHRIDLQIVRWRCRAQAQAPARPMAMPYRRISPHGDLRTAAQDQRPPDTLLPCAALWLQTRGSGLPLTSRAKHGIKPVGGSTMPYHSCSLGAAWWYGLGPALPRGPSLDGGKTDSTVDRAVDRGRTAKRCGHILTTLATHKRLRVGFLVNYHPAWPFLRVIIVSGPPSAGKATLARRLTTDLELPPITKADLKGKAVRYASGGHASGANAPGGQFCAPLLHRERDV